VEPVTIPGTAAGGAAGTAAGGAFGPLPGLRFAVVTRARPMAPGAPRLRVAARAFPRARRGEAPRLPPSSVRVDDASANPLVAAASATIASSTAFSG